MKHGNPYEIDNGEKRRGTIWMVATIVVTLALSLTLCWMDKRNADLSEALAEETETYQEDYLPGQPLDAVRLTAPTFSDSDHCYKVADRTSGACWWLVKVEGEWHVLPVCDGGSYVAQQGEEN